MISVCIATFNGEKYIKEQLESILPQLAPTDEIVISDDGSTDNTLPIIKSLQDDRIHILQGPQLHSPTLNFENALKAAKGEDIFLADQDDVWKERKVEICLQELTHYDCVISDAEVTDAHLRVTFPSLFKILHVRKNKYYNILLKNGYTGCCMAFKRHILERALPFPKEIPMHDIWIGNIAAFHYHVVFIHDKLIYFRRHQEANSCNGRGSRYSICQKIRFRWQIIKNLIISYLIHKK